MLDVKFILGVSVGFIAATVFFAIVGVLLGQ